MAFSSAVRELWISADGSGRLRIAVPALTFASTVDESAWEAAGRPSQRAIDQSFGPGGLKYEHVELLPTDTSSLKKVVAASTAAHVNEIGRIAQLLLETPASASLRGSLFEVASGLPNTTEKTGTDKLGREGRLLSGPTTFDGLAATHMLLFDASDFRLLEDTTILDSLPLGWDIAGPIVVSRATVEESRIATTTDLVPAATSAVSRPGAP
jgi:hypothetical protein